MAKMASHDFLKNDQGEGHEFISNDEFSSLGINIRSLNTSHCSQLEIFLNDLPFDPCVIAINESYLKDNESGPHSCLSKHHFLSNCRIKYKGGGVGLYVRDALNYRIRSDITKMEDKI